MKAKDFRIGNCVFYNGKYKEIGVISEIKTSIIPNTEYIGLNHRIDVYHQTKHLQPIPLTEEILLKCGFVSNGAKQWLFITLDKKDECYLYFNPLGKGIAINQNDKECSFEIELNYLHQLQNLYFALTNQELNIEL